jgi:hypothetical protein
MSVQSTSRLSDDDFESILDELVHILEANDMRATQWMSQDMSMKRLQWIYKQCENKSFRDSSAVSRFNVVRDSDFGHTVVARQVGGEFMKAFLDKRCRSKNPWFRQLVSCVKQILAKQPIETWPAELFDPKHGVPRVLPQNLHEIAIKWIHVRMYGKDEESMRCLKSV